MNFLPKSRLDAFADGVFAIAITLLVLELPIPEASEDIIPALMQAWPDFLAYFISFAFIGGIWIAHSSITHLMKQETTNSYRLTLLMLFFVSLVPFTTKLMATHIYGPNSTAPVIIYGLDLLATSMTLNWIVNSAANTPDMLVDELARSELNALKRKRQYIVAINGCALIIALLAPRIAIAMYIAVAILFVLIAPISDVRRRHG